MKFTKIIDIVGICTALIIGSASLFSPPEAQAAPDPQGQSPNPIEIKPYNTEMLPTPYTLTAQATNYITFNRALVLETLPGQVPIVTVRGLNKSTNIAATALSLFFKVSSVQDPTTLSDTNLYQLREIVQNITLANNAKVNTSFGLTTITNTRWVILYKVGISSLTGETNASGQGFTVSNCTATVWK